MKVNYQLEMERELARIAGSGRRPRLLLHACCAPCSSAVLERLTDAFDIALYFYNPNIAPQAEFLRRAAELERLVRELPHANAIEVLRGDYDEAAFAALSRGLESAPEGGARCERCFRLRLGKTARLAAQGGFDYFTTTLSISPHKDAQLLNAIGAELSAQTGVAYLHSDFKKRDGYRRSCALSALYGLYRQDYCGCAFSRAVRDRRAASEAPSA